MIPFEFEYCQPETVDEAIQTFITLDARGLKPKYYAGGTEIITMARVGSLSFGALIDIKHIPECTVLAKEGASLLLGSALPLSRAIEADVFHLLTLAAQRVADHTVQHKITLGGNVAGTIIYHEAVLPLLISGCRVVLAGPQGRREAPLTELYHPRLSLQPGELVVQFIVSAGAAALPCVHVKHTESEKIGYPLITAAAVRKSSEILMAFAGIQPYPVIMRIDAAGNGTPQAAAERQFAQISEPLLTDSLATREYRGFLLKSIIANILETLGDADA